MRPVPKKTENFEAFYYKHVATGEGCGCAERIIDVHEFNRLRGSLIPQKGAFRRLLQRLRLRKSP